MEDEDELENALDFAYKEYFKNRNLKRAEEITQMFNIQKEYCNYLLKKGRQYLEKRIPNQFSFKELADELDEGIKEMEHEILQNSLEEYLKHFCLLN